MGLALVGVTLVTLVLFIFLIITKRQIDLLKNVKKQEDRERRHRLSKSLSSLKWGLAVSLVVVVITGSLALFGGRTAKEIYLEHTHGLGFSSDGKRILIPAHDGLKAYEQGRWFTPEGAKHDYMGFSPVDEGFYSSGHPAPDSNLNNPFGIVKSLDEGKTLQSLALDGETDFHNMAVGYISHVIYAYNPQPNSQMNKPGLFYSKNEGKTWTNSNIEGVSEEPTTIAVHPSEASIVAIGTPTGVYLSKDFGNRFEKVMSVGQNTSLFFNITGELFIGGFQDGAYLVKMDLKNNKTEQLTIPALTEDAVAYFAQNAIDDDQMAFTTFKNDVYYSIDKGVSWTKIADQGKSISYKDEEGK
ncbi:F510_1955 family glycosylhydrolase [Brevibacillus panacihumi]|uniref:F510_1955 family glycosylhydrolase n=1 Tax=Brevibacillus panacihumi TaxID=497735 RepID=UPI003CFC55F7